MAYLGQELKKERELRGISLKEIADATKINIRFLQAIEEDQWDVLPGQFFTRGIIRSYSHYLGMESEPFLNTYLEMERALKEGRDPEETKSTDEEVSIPQRIKSALYFSLIIVVIIAVLCSLYFILKKEEPAPTIQEKKSPPTVKKAAELPPSIPEKKEEAIVSELLLSISFTERTWIRITADGNRILEANRNPGEPFSVTASQELILDLGNAGGIRFTLNGKPGKALGRSGDVIWNIRINLDNYQEFLAENIESPTTGAY